MKTKKRKTDQALDKTDLKDKFFGLNGHEICVCVHEEKSGQVLVGPDSLIRLTTELQN